MTHLPFLKGLGQALFMTSWKAENDFIIRNSAEKSVVKSIRVVLGSSGCRVGQTLFLQQSDIFSLPWKPIYSLADPERETQ